MRISQLDGRRVALWGWGREGRAAYQALRGRLPGLALTLFCEAPEVAAATAPGDPLLAVETDASAGRLASFDVVVKSPGISPYRPEALVAAHAGTAFIGGTTLWFGEQAGASGIARGVACVTGTKGKSTTTALLAHLLRAGGTRTALAGNIGVPLLELLDARADAWAVELSSYQTRDVAASGVRPDVAVVTNLFPEHLDWHGSEDRYIEDKLTLVMQARPRVAVLNADDPRLAVVGARLDPATEVRWYGRADGWHLRGDVVHRGEAAVLDGRDVPLPGRHNLGNLCAALAAVEALGFDAVALAGAARGFRPLPHRLQLLGERGGATWVNDSISTTPHASLAALEVYRDRRVALLVGGHDRGLDWSDFAAVMRTRAPAVVVAMAANGPRIHALLAEVAVEGGFDLRQASDLATAMDQARAGLSLSTRPASGDVVLLSPGAPSFGAYRDYTERGRDFARLAGFDPDAITAIPGLGIAAGNAA
ncbi:UDP-N-acetylmuramoyl-L-alanine--D-glutamate ligase [Luteimonas sp. MC1572]|uniref:UDP-N-acetylmuramoyl-L-alanine--D-glutamate ligase n=1 Tax=Luteimonas sp. MC1572 TaxID=2799325 RepID=UPI0018F0778A|nr:UDP-N-acetylmuramoyl-L-alanine--D-glutamate ligase [Luteimonas sp. MC1572]MBJ6982575.1 UDP-N-acetylmuramoyl-L-alanine--D-glutamate ligase [Luteimonas sp. MC1572]QQO03825.1 UDP-N-acetylmuramoyl-L-alanine--D-glutamate ligase [Luteimonas sp. MC1572]